MPSKTVKCNRCKCNRKKQEFKRRNKTFKTCNYCADLDRKYQQKKKTKDHDRKRDPKLNANLNPKTESEQVITLVDLWPDTKDSTNSEIVKNNPKINYTVLWDDPKGLEEIECKYDEIPSSFKFRILIVILLVICYR